MPSLAVIMFYIYMCAFAAEYTTVYIVDGAVLVHCERSVRVWLNMAAQLSGAGNLEFGSHLFLYSFFHLCPQHNLTLMSLK